MSKEPAETLAIIKGLRIGVGDRGVPVITFTTYTHEHYAATQGVYGAEAIHQFIADSGVSDLSKLNGTPCWVQIDGSFMRFLRLWKEDR